MFPLKDENPTVRIPYFTITFIGICCVVFLMQWGSGEEAFAYSIYSYGLIPANLFSNDILPFDQQEVPASFTLITSMFLHGGWMHLIGNMVFLWIFGNNIEDILGHGRFVLFYLICGLAAAFAQIISDPGSEIPMVGASGAVSGVMGAYIVLFPRAKILTLIWLGIFITTMRISAGWFLGVWFAMQSFNAMATIGVEGGGVAFWAHVGGFVAGMILVLFLKPKTHTLIKTRKGPWG